MAEFRQGVLTTNGLNLLARAQAGQAQIAFTKFQIGDGEWDAATPDETIMATNALRNPRAEFAIGSAEYVNPATALLTVVASNIHNTESGYYIREVGVFATDGNTEILYAVYLATAPDWLPAYNSITPSSITYSIYITVANARDVTVPEGGGSLVTRTDLEREAKRLDAANVVEFGVMMNEVRMYERLTDDRIDNMLVEVDTRVRSQLNENTFMEHAKRSIDQATLRDLEERLAAAEAKLAAMT